jgi:uncharacterized repeat protein (TIGR03803 family)
MMAVFCVATAIASHAQTFTSLHIFNQKNQGPGFMTQGTDGNFYGPTANSIFKMTPSGQTTLLYVFCQKSGCPDGDGPSTLVQASDGNFYGTTYTGGKGAHCKPETGNCGTVFKITPKGALTTLYNFCSQAGCADGNQPTGLILGTDGNFYGTSVGYNGAPTCPKGNSTGCGTVFKITPTGTLTVLHEFCSETNCADGYGSFAQVVLGTDGNFYGTTVYGGANEEGTVFKITPQGTFTTLYAFCSETNCVDGSQPTAALAQAADGNFYGTTSDGGVNLDCNGIGCGTIFEITPVGQLTTLYNFCSVAGCADGSDPHAALTLGTDGNFYGTTENGGANNYGTIFQLTSGSQFNSLYSFFCTGAGCSDGAIPTAGLLQATNGTFYGTTETGGNWRTIHNLGPGVAYSWSMNLGPFVEAQFNFGSVGQIVTILGNNLTGTTSVTFNGTSAKFKVESNTYLKAEVPAGATTGTIQVTTPSGTLNSNVAFQVSP